MSHATPSAPARGLQQLPAFGLWYHLEAALLAVLPIRLRFVWLWLTGHRRITYPVRLLPLAERPEGLVIRHGLGRAHRGWLLTDKQGPGLVFELAPDRVAGLGEPDDPALYLASTEPVTVNVLVF